MPPSVREALATAAVLTGARDEELGIPRARRVLGKGVDQETLNAALRARLAHVPQLTNMETPSLERFSGASALACALRIHVALEAHDEPIGARDGAVLNQLIAIAFTWLVAPAVLEFDAALAAVHPDDSVNMHAQLRDANADEASFRGAVALLIDIASTLRRILANSPQQNHTQVTAIVLRIYLADVLKVLLRTAYAADVRVDWAEPFINSVTLAVPAQSALAALRQCSATKIGMSPVPRVIRTHAARLLSAQLLRPDGVRALIVGALGSNSLDGEHDESLERLESVAKLLTTPPKDTPPSTYVARLVPSLVTIIDASSDAAQVPRRAAAFTLVRLHEKYRAPVEEQLAQLLIAPLYTPGSPKKALGRLVALVLLAPPSPDWLNTVVVPAVQALLSLDTFAEAGSGVRDQNAAAELDALAIQSRDTLRSWLRMSDQDICVKSILSAAAASFRPKVEWTLDPTLNLVTSSAKGMGEVPMDVMTSEDHVVSSLAGSLHFSIDPTRVARIVVDAQRVDISGSLFIAALEEYQRASMQGASGFSEGVDDDTDRRAVFYLQLVAHLHSLCGKDLVEGDVGRTLLFIDFVFERGDTEELQSTVLNLFLAVLERHPEISPSSNVLVSKICDQIKNWHDAQDPEVRALASEVTLVLSARSHAVPAAPDAPKYKEVYNEALKYLQDPVVPVRAYGLTLLTRLVSIDSKEYGETYGSELDPALLPAIFDLLIKAVQDDESFLYLNAIKGLSQMAVNWKNETLRQLVAVYVGGEKINAGMISSLKYGATLSQNETDKRLRVGEALVQVIQYLGDAVRPVLASLIGPLLTALRNDNFSATLRSSFIAVLGTCVEIVPGAIAALTGAQLAETALDLIAVESVDRPQRKAVRAYVNGEEQMDDSDDDKEARAGIDTDSKLPQLRRSALLLLAYTIRASLHLLEEYTEAQQRTAGDVDAPLTALRLPGGSLLPSVEEGPLPVRPTPPELLVPLALVPRIVLTAEKVHTWDTDTLVRQQAQDCVLEARQLEAAAVQASI